MNVGPQDVKYGLVSTRTGKLVEKGYKSRREAENKSMEATTKVTTIGYISDSRRQDHGE